MLALTIATLTAKRLHPLGPKQLRARALPVLVIRGLSGLGFMGSYYYALKVLEISDAVVLTYTYPVLTSIAAALILGEAWARLDALGTGMCLIGVLLISQPPFLMNLCGVEASTQLQPLPGLVSAFVASLFATVVYLSIRVVKGISPAVWVNALAVVSLLLAPVMGLLVFEEIWSWPSMGELAMLVLMAALAYCGETLMAIGLTLETAAKATSMNYVQVALSFVFQTVGLHQPSNGLKIVGAVLISSWGVIVVSKEHMKLRSRQTTVSDQRLTDLQPITALV